MTKFINNLLDDTPSITLEEMDKVALMNRIDNKYMFLSKQLHEILKKVKLNYKILDIEGSKISKYESFYFDTSKFDFYLWHHNGRLNRYKVRYRKYINSNICFFEIKRKTNKGRTIKKRIKVNEVPTVIDNYALDLLKEIVPAHLQVLEKKIQINFRRMTFVSNDMKERVTVDVDLEFKNGTISKSFPTLVIVEIKRDGIGIQSPFMKLLHEKNIKETSFSKYCMGVVNLYPSVKYNSFKPKIRFINKLLYAAA